MISLKDNIVKGLKIIIRYGLIVINDGFICFKSNPKITIFESFSGNDINDNPAAIYWEFIKKHPELRYTTYFSVKSRFYKKLHERYPKIKLLRRFSLKWVWIMAHSRIWVFNSRMPQWWKKNRQTIYIQTWHGTPLKHLGIDIEHVSIPGNSTVDYRRQFIREAARWKYLIAPNNFSMKVFRSAFQFNNEFLPIGYPRNDILYKNNQPDVIAQLKKKLVGQSTATVILYSPTWRDDSIKKGQYRFNLPFDLGNFFEHVSNNTMLVLRPHYLVKDHINISGFEDRVKILADNDIAQLYLIVDLLITDYSSVMFDYANLKRPMMFYAYDLEHYRDDLRGFYVNYKAEIPGPLATTENQLYSALETFDQNQCFPKYRKALISFSQKYCSWETGKASSEVVKIIEQEMLK